MCNFFSFVTNPDSTSDVYYFDWEYRKNNLSDDGVDSHSHICAYFGIDEDKCNKWEYNPLTSRLICDMQNAKKDDRNRVKRWVDKVNWKTIVEPLIIKPIVNPLELPKVEHVTDEQVDWLKSWASVRASVRVSVWNSVRVSVRASVGYSVWNSVGDSVGDSVWNSVWNSVEASFGYSVWNSVEALVGAYVSSFLDIPYQHDFTPAVKLWDDGLVPSFNYKTWRLHSGKDAKIIYEWTPEEREDSE